ncbi:unnamed protein product [Urochloa humidicola]
MASLDPPESGDPDAGAPRAGAGDTQAPTTHPLPHPTAAPCAPPTTRFGPPLASRSAAAVEASSTNCARPGVLFQERLLHDFHSTAFPGAFPTPCSDAAFLWITPPFRAIRFNSSYITTLLSFHFTAPPDLLRARKVGTYVFRVRVANTNIANYLASRGHLEFNRQRFTLHSSAGQAMAAAEKLKEEDTVKASQLPSCCFPFPNTGINHPGKGAIDVASLETSAAQTCRAEISRDTAFTEASGLGLLPTPGQNVWQQAETGSAPAPPAFTAPQQPAAKPYLNALLTPAKPLPPKQRRIAPIPFNPTACFRCLSLDHQVRHCRNSLVCRICHATGHRSFACPMVIPREHTPHPSRRPTIPLPASRAPIHAVPFSRRTTPPPSATPTPPPTPLNLPPFTTSFDPLNMLASSSAGPSVGVQIQQPKEVTPKRVKEPAEEGPFFLGDLFHEPIDTGKGILSMPPRRAPPQIPKARDIRMVGRGTSMSPSRSPVREETGVTRGRSPRSPPSPVAPPVLPEPVRPQEAPQEDGALTEPSDEEEEESVESDALDDGPEYVQIWIREGNWNRAARFATATIDPPAAAANLAPLIRGMFLNAAPELSFQFVPSSHGAALLHFSSAQAREEAMAIQPLHHDGTTISLTRVEETDDRFIREPAWLALVVVWNYPEEHWDQDKVRDIYCCVGTVVEIDPSCFATLDRSCMRFVIELQHPHVPYRVGAHPPSGRGIVLRQNALRFWPRAEQFDATGAWIPFFGPPPPPPAGFGTAAGGLLPPPPVAFGPPPPPAPPAPQNPPPLHPAAFLGASILCHGFVCAFPMARLPAFPICIQLPATSMPRRAEPPPLHRVAPMLLLTWNTAPPPPSPNAPHIQPVEQSPLVANNYAPAANPNGRVGGVRKKAAAVATRNSTRLAAKDSGKFVRVADKASQLKALQNSLALCSKPVQLHVTKKKLLKKTKKPIAAEDLKKLADAVSLGNDSAAALDKVLAIGNATSCVLDRALEAAK